MQLAMVKGAYRTAVRATHGAAVLRKRGELRIAEKTAEIISMRVSYKKPLDVDDYRRFARQINVDPAALHAFADVESGRDGGFAPDGRLLIAIEPHIFSRLTGHAYDKLHPELSYPDWIRRKDGTPFGWKKHPYDMTQLERWSVWAQWAQLNFPAACGALSGGRFQQLIKHAKKLGFRSNEHLLRYLFQSEQNQMDVLMAYLQSFSVVRPLRDKDWYRVARRYNGRGKALHYAGEMEESYNIRRVNYV